MNCAALITDIHIGVRSNAPHYHNQYERFFTETFFPYLRAKGIKHVINAGDTFDKQTNIDFVSLSRAKDYFFEPLREFQAEFVVGNHDRYYKSTNAINACSLLLREYDNIRVFVNAGESVNHEGILYVPWINRENAAKTLELLQSSKCRTVIGHLELSGYKMYANSNESEGLDPKFFARFGRVYTGHFHHRSRKGNVEYIGAATEQTWSDFNDWRGFHILDLDTHEIVESIENPFHMFEKITVKQDSDLIAVDDVKDRYVRIEVAKDADPKVVDRLKDTVQKGQAADITVDDMSVIKEIDIDLTAADILTLIERHVTLNVHDNEQTKRMIAMMQRWYQRVMEENQ